MITGEIGQEHPEAQGRWRYLGQQRGMAPQGRAGELEYEMEDGIRVGGRLLGLARHWIVLDQYLRCIMIK